MSNVCDRLSAGNNKPPALRTRDLPPSPFRLYAAQLCNVRATIPCYLLSRSPSLTHCRISRHIDHEQQGEKTSVLLNMPEGSPTAYDD